MKPWYVADFETTGKQEYERVGYTRVWLYAVCDSDSQIVNYGGSIDDFMKWCKSNSGAVVYFHNLRFDGSFILNWLINHGYAYKEDITARDSMKYKTIIGEEGQFYQIKISFTSASHIEIRDSLKIIPLKVKEIAKTFNLPIEKEIIDYDKFEINDTTLHYVYNDVRIVAMGLKFFYDKGFSHMTIGSDSYHEFMDNERFGKELYPDLGEDFLKEWRKAYRGGRSQVNPKYAGKVLNNVKRFDINSMYPFMMGYRWLPYGMPIECSKPGQYKFELYHVNIMFKLKKGHLPCLLRKQARNYYSSGDSYYVNTDLIEDMYISNIDLEMVKRHYDIEVLEFKKIYGFRTTMSQFNPFVMKYYNLKKQEKGGLRLVYKLILNNLYGKFGSKPLGRNKIPYIDDNGGMKFTMTEQHEMQHYYLPVAIAVTSYAHDYIDQNISYDLDNFVYCDTDSIHTLGTVPSELIDNHEIGKFKLEGTEEISKYIRQKCYVYKQNGSWTITCAGMTEGLKEYLNRHYGDKLIDVFDTGLSIDEHSEGIQMEDLKLRPRQVKGGVILEPVPFSIK